MERLLSSLSRLHPVSSATQFLNDMMWHSKWNHLFRVLGKIDYPVMPRDFYFVPQETILVKGMQMPGEKEMVVFFSKYGHNKASTVVVGLRRDGSEEIPEWHPHSLYLDLYLCSERLRSVWGADRCTIPTFQIWTP